MQLLFHKVIALPMDISILHIPGQVIVTAEPASMTSDYVEASQRQVSTRLKVVLQYCMTSKIKSVETGKSPQ